MENVNKLIKAIEELKTESINDCRDALKQKQECLTSGGMVLAYGIVLGKIKEIFNA